MRVSSPALTFDEAQRLPVAVHPDPTCHKVDRYTAGPVHTASEEHYTGLHIAQFLNNNNPAAAAIRHELLAFRELLQNMFDELIRANGGTYNGIEFVEGIRRQKTHFEDVICFHNRERRLAEIIVTDKTTKKKEHFYYGHQKPAGELPCEAGEYGTLVFVNYGTVIPKMGQLLTMGYSTKHGVPNQVGMYGEGLKTAVLRLLRCGAGVEIYCCTNEWSVRPVTQRLRFFVSTDKTKTIFGTLGDSRTSIEPNEWSDGSGDKVRFQVQVIYPKKSYESAVYTAETVEAKPKNFGFKIGDYLLSSALIHNRTGPNDHGFVVQQHQQQQGRVYACNFHVFDDANWIVFSYNLFTTVGRDRNTVNQNVLRHSIMEIWNAVFQNPRETALQIQFYERMRTALESGNDNRWLEFQCLDDLGEKAREVITGIFRSKHTSVQAVLLERDMSTTATLLQLSASDNIIKTVHPTLYGILTSQHGQCYLKFEDWLKIEQTKLRDDALVAENDEDAVPAAIVSLMAEQNVVFKSGKTSRAKWEVEEGNRVLINWSILSTSSPTTDSMLNKLICKWLPSALGSHFDIVPLLKRTVLRVSLRNANKDDDTEPGPASTRKRSAEETAVVCPYPPIEGTKWQYGWFLHPQ